MNLTYKVRGLVGQTHAVRVTFQPPLSGYEEVKPRLLGMTADAYEAPLTAWNQPPPSSSPRDVNPPSAGYYSGEIQKPHEHPPPPPPPLQQRKTAMELQPELMRVEAPRDAERIELDANVSQSNLNRKFS